MVVAVNDTVARLPELAVRTLVPAVVPRVHDPTAAIPEASVTALPPAIDPPPLVTANVTGTPAIADPY